MGEERWAELTAGRQSETEERQEHTDKVKYKTKSTAGLKIAETKQILKLTENTHTHTRFS